MKELQNKQDIQLLVDAFYQKVLNDELLSPFFQKIDFKLHQPKMVHFWCFVLFDEPGYTTNVTQKHEHMKLSKVHFDRWLELFNATTNALFIGEKAEKAKERASILAWTMGSKFSQ